MFTRRVELSPDEYLRLKSRVQGQFLANELFSQLFYEWFDKLPVDSKRMYWEHPSGSRQAEQYYLDILFEEFAKEKGIINAKELARHAQGASRFY